MLNQFSREELLIGKEAMNKLKKAKVAIIGIGGVGSFVLEGLARAGIGNFVLVDDDKICLTNINRQIIALRSTISKPKVEVAKARVLDINPDAKVEIYQEFFMPETEGILDKSIDYIVDAVDTVTAKVELVMRANELNIPIICSMGTGNKLDPTKFVITDIYKTEMDPLAKVMRKEMKKRGIKHLKVLYSKEQPVEIDENAESSCKTNCICPPDTKRTCAIRNQVPGSISFVPSVAGLIIASEVVRDLLKAE
ncbi:MAG: tRNA threonylcarbamoyladenosine dehydratase [Clostridia bacterium]|nr:tRNA threonylcarbamoyladenosine dehydratase [Clostridia bacterium]